MIYQAFTIPRELRTIQSTVPHDALSRVADLFTREVSIHVLSVDAVFLPGFCPGWSQGPKNRGPTGTEGVQS